jgi:hypothetical protein
MHGDDEHLYVVELPMRNPFEKPDEWLVKVSTGIHWRPTLNRFDTKEKR